MGLQWDKQAALRVSKTRTLAYTVKVKNPKAPAVKREAEEAGDR